MYDNDDFSGPTQMSLSRQAEQTMLEAYGHRPISGRGSPGPSRRGVSTGTQTPAGVHPTPRITRKHSADNTFVYRQLTLDDSLDAPKDQPQRVLSGSAGAGSGGGVLSGVGSGAVSYTHLTLPTNHRV